MSRALATMATASTSSSLSSSRMYRRVASNNAATPSNRGYIQRHWPRARLCATEVRTFKVVAAASAASGGGAAVIEKPSYKQILLSLFDGNVYLSDASRQAVAATAGLASAHSSSVTVLFVDEEGKHVEGTSRIEQIELALQGAGCAQLQFVERSCEPSVGKGSVAVGDVADELEADLVVLSSDAVHSKAVDANLLAEFVNCPVLLLP